jgi:hypothetical protein
MIRILPDSDILGFLEMQLGFTTLKTEISEMIRNSDMNDPHNTEMHRDAWIIVVILFQFRTISAKIEGFSLPFRNAPICPVSISEVSFFVPRA